MLSTVLLNTLAVIAYYVSTANSFGLHYWNLRRAVERDRESEVREQLKLSFFRAPSDRTQSPFRDNFLVQPLDHFDAQVKATYSQRFWVNGDFWRPSDGPVFLYIGGEGALSSLTVQAGEHVDLARKYRALVLAVEHRYYGDSLNLDGLKLNNMQYLSSQQALADLASFHLHAQKTYNITAKNSWICFGGSYPGALSAWFRIKYPQLVFGAVASSAPVRAKVNFEGYNEVIASSLADPIVNGSLKCVHKVKEAFEAVDKLIAQRKWRKLASDFESCRPISNEDDVMQAASNLGDIFSGVIQYNNEMKTGLNISSLCAYMTSAGKPYDNLRKLNKISLEYAEQTCQDNSWTDFIALVSNTTVLRGQPGVGIRQWLYQTCTQFGYYQTCDLNTSCVLSHYIRLDPNFAICRDVFKISKSQVYDQVAFTNAYYGSDSPKGTRIVFVNGSIDPWHWLSVIRDASLTEVAVYIAGTAHCANMASGKPGDPSALTNARQRIDAMIGEWLKEAAKEFARRKAFVRSYSANY